MERIRSGLASGILALACTVPSYAAAQDSGGYLGGSLGQTTFNGFCSDVNGLLVSLGAVPAGCDEKDTGFKIFGGYRVNRNLAVEGSYFDYGDASARGSFGGAPVRLSGDATAFGVAALGILPLNAQVSLFGKAGLLITDINVTAAGPGGVGRESGDETGLHYGAGALFSFPGNRLGVRLEWERNDEIDLDMLSIGLQLRF